MQPNSDQNPPTVLWLRRDLRLSDHPGWEAALSGPGPVVPVFILDDLVMSEYGAAALWRLGESLRSLAADLAASGSRLILRRGQALDVLRALIEETGARTIVWSRLYDSASIARDKAIKAALVGDGIEAVSVNASLLHEPWTVETKTGGLYKVYTPFWRAVRDRAIRTPLAAPNDLRPLESWPETDALGDWHLGRRMQRGAPIVARHAAVGEAAAQKRLGIFIAEKIETYGAERDLPGVQATSRLSENLTYGEISPHQAWAAGWRAMQDGRRPDQAETFLKELVWREFAYHLVYHTPHIETASWKPEWEHFPWRDDNSDAERWRRGMTGIEMVDAGMREMYVTGTMHNRVRMLVASFLTKHLMVHWKVGEAWFRDCLIDWDPASNAMGWQWVAGSGPDAAPFFRIFNPDGQAEKFDANRAYRDRFLAEGRSRPHADATAFYDAIPSSWEIFPHTAYPSPVIALSDGRQRALDAYRDRASVKTD